MSFKLYVNLTPTTVNSFISHKDIGRQVFSNNLSLFLFEMHVIVPLFNESVSAPLLKHVLTALNKYTPRSLLKNLKKS